MLHLDTHSGQSLHGNDKGTLASDTFIVNNTGFNQVRINIVVDGYRHQIAVPACKSSNVTVITWEVELESYKSEEEG